MGDFFIDTSNWEQRLYEYSKKMICNNGIFEYSQEKECFKFSDNENDILKRLVNDPVNSHLHWLGIGVGTEILIKSVLLKYKIMPIRNRNITKKYPRKSVFKSIEENEEYFSDDIAMVYRSCTRKVISKKNLWIQQQLDNQDIEYIFDIKTPTLGWIYNTGIDKLFENGIINQNNKTLLKKSIETFTDIRRNVDSHIFWGRTIGSIQKDREKIYLPMFNTINELYLK